MSVPAGYSSLLRPNWQYIEKVSLEDFTAADWATMNRQRDEYQRAEQARQVLRMLDAAARRRDFRLHGQQLSACAAIGDDGDARRPG